MLGGVVAAVLVAGVIGCSDAKKSAKGSKSPAAETVIAAAIDGVGPGRAQLDSVEGNRALLTAVLGVRGVALPEIDCYFAKVIPVLGERRFQSLTVHEIQAWTKVTVLQLPLSVREDAATCIGPETLARRKAKEIAPDFDLAAARQAIRTAAVAQAVAVGLTTEEAECYTAASMDRLTDEEFHDGLTGQASRSIRRTDESIRSCLTPKRRKQLVEPLSAAIEAQTQIDASERKIVESKLNNEVRSQMTTTTTGR